MEGLLLLTAVLLPAVAGLMVAFWPWLNEDRENRCTLTGAVLAVQLLLIVLIALEGEKTVVLLSLGENIPIALRSDRMGIVFSIIMSAMWLVSGIFSFDYMSHEKNEKQYYSFYLLSLSALTALCFSATLVTMYLFFELMTLLTLALVLHSRTEASIAAAIKYLIYSIAGATMGLLGIFFLIPNTTSQYFVLGGSLNTAALTVSPGMMLGILLITIVGFCTKAGMFPLHGWLPTAHPVAPSPASAVLSGIITKAGVLCVIRVIYYAVGADFLHGTWVQSVLLSCAVITVFMGSMLALKEKLFKKRLAYSSVSQVSYVLCGVFLMNQTAIAGSLLHVIFHALIKDGLFLCAGAIILKTGLIYVDEYKGLGKKMPVVFFCFTLLSLGLIGIPPTGGFISKLYIAEGAINAGTGLPEIFTWLVPAVLLVSALLTAGYLLPISINAYFSTPDAAVQERLPDNIDTSPIMAWPIIALTAAVVLLGTFPKPLINAFEAVASLLIV